MGLVTGPFLGRIASIKVEIEQLPKYYRLFFSGHPSSRMLTTTYFDVTNASEWGEFPGGMRCHCKTLLR